MKKEKMQKQNLHEGHRERMRRKWIVSKGAGFSQHELLEMLLYYTIPRADTNQIAHLLMKQFDSLYALLTQGDYYTFTSVPGIGEKSAVLLSLIGEILKSSTDCKRRNSEFLRSYEDFCQYFLKQLQHQHASEILMTVFLSDAMQVVRCEKIESALPNTAKIHLRKIVKWAFQSNCTSVILAHNHPAGEALPSYQDIAETKLLQERLKMLEIDLLDHVIIGNGKAYSMKKHHDF
ncbi:MAG: hypothetical protein IJJ69_02755 [Oscillospiraceae bacterium]|nr:hypothetical protein [Oscillospiraceae bacterium]